MQAGDVYLIEYKGLTNLVAVAESRDVKFNGKNGQSFKLLLAIEINNSSVPIFYSDCITGEVNKDIVLSECVYSMKSFIEEYKEEVASVLLFKETSKLNCSWLMTLQLAAFYRENKNHEENESVLALFYEQAFAEQKKSLDFFSGG